jgi:hypothetical protein
MRKFINLLEGTDPTAINDDEVEHDFDIYQELESRFQQMGSELRMRRHVEDVYLYCIDSIDFEKAVAHVAKRENVDPLELRAACVEDYKQLRKQFQTYTSYEGMKLVSMLNPIIREAFEQAEQVLLEKSVRIGSYVAQGGDVLSVLRAEHDPKHHVFVNSNGDVVGSHYGTSDEVHQKLIGDGFTYKLIDQKRK